MKPPEPVLQVLAQPNQDGLVNVAVGDVTIAEDVNVGVAAQRLWRQGRPRSGPRDRGGRSGETATVCTTPTGPVTIA
jgi:hypothetical protein